MSVAVTHGRPTMLGLGIMALSWALAVERVTRIELALSAWEVQWLPLPGTLTRRPWQSRVSLVDLSPPRLMAR
jgi:hypothetical protein